MIIHTSEQGTPEWFYDRAGVISASMFVEIRKVVNGLTEQQKLYVEASLAGKSDDEAKEIAGYKSNPRPTANMLKALDRKPVGDYSDAVKDYAFKLAVERIGKVNLEERTFSGWQAERGKVLEEDCRIRHEADIGTIVDLAGFITTDCGRFGCSADSLVDDDGGGEYKCFLAPAKLRPIILNDDWGDVMDQSQGGIFITERKWWDICLYCPALKMIGKDFMRHRTYRDDEYIKGLKADLERFDNYVEAQKEKIVSTCRIVSLPKEEAEEFEVPEFEEVEEPLNIAINF